MKYLILFLALIPCAYAQHPDFDNTQKRYWVYDNQNRLQGTWERSGSMWSYQPNNSMKWRSKVLPSTGQRLIYSSRKPYQPRRYYNY